METEVLNYTIIVEPDTETGTDKPGYTAFCPSLGLADDGDSIDEALINIKATIQFHLESLAEEGETLPLESAEPSLMTKIQIPITRKLSTLLPKIYA